MLVVVSRNTIGVARTMNWIDVILSLLCAMSLVQGFRKGLLGGVIGIVGIITAGLCIDWFGRDVALWLEHSLSVPAALSVIFSYTIVFGLVFWALHFVTRPVSRSIRHSSLSILNRMLGAFFAVGIVLLFSGILFDAVDHILPRGRLSISSVLPGGDGEPVYHKDARDNSLLYDPVRTTVAGLSLKGSIKEWQQTDQNIESSEQTTEQ